MTIAWPANVVPRRATATLLVPPVQHRSANGAGTQQVTFQQRFSFNFEFPPQVMARGTDAFGKYLAASNDTLEIDIPPNVFGSPLVGTGAQVAALWNDAGGRILQVKGLNAGVAIPSGVPVSIRTGGRWYVYFTTEAALVGASRSLTLSGLAHTAHALNDEVRIQFPIVEGYVSPPVYDVDINLLPNVTLTVTPA